MSTVVRSASRITSSHVFCAVLLAAVLARPLLATVTGAPAVVVAGLLVFGGAR